MNFISPPQSTNSASTTQFDSAFNAITRIHNVVARGKALEDQRNRQMAQQSALAQQIIANKNPKEACMDPLSPTPPTPYTREAPNRDLEQGRLQNLLNDALTIINSTPEATGQAPRQRLTSYEISMISPSMARNIKG